MEPPIVQASEPAAEPREEPSSREPAARRGATLWSRLKNILPLRPASLREDLQEALDEEANGDSAEFSANERAILQNVLKLGDLRVDDVSVPRSDIEAVEADLSMGHLIAHFRRAGHSRLPVYEESLDNIKGFIHVKDALRAVTAPGADPTRDIPIKLLTAMLRQKIGRSNILRDVLFVAPSMPVAELLKQMQQTRVHLAVVVDEYGGTDGLVSIEDLLEAVVGEIDDEHDVAGPLLVRKIDDNTFIADARAELDELQAVIGPDFNPGPLGEEIDTLGGLVFDLVDRVPTRGETVSELPGFDFLILAADNRRIKKLKIMRRARGANGAPDTEPPASSDTTGGDGAQQAAQ